MSGAGRHSWETVSSSTGRSRKSGQGRLQAKRPWLTCASRQALDLSNHYVTTNTHTHTHTHVHTRTHAHRASQKVHSEHVHTQRQLRKSKTVELWRFLSRLRRASNTDESILQFTSRYPPKAFQDFVHATKICRSLQFVAHLEQWPKPTWLSYC